MPDFPIRKRLPDERKSKTVRGVVDGTKFYITAGEFEDGSLGEVFITVSKEGDELRAYKGLSIAMSVGLQYGVPPQVFIDKLKHQRMEPAGITGNDEIPIAKSILDFMARWLEPRYGEKKEEKKNDG